MQAAASQFCFLLYWITKISAISGQKSWSKDEPFGGLYLQSEANRMSSLLRGLTNQELGVSQMQEVFDSLPFQEASNDPKEIVEKMAFSLSRKLHKYILVLDGNRHKVEKLNYHHKQQPIIYKNPCCKLPSKRLKYNSHFGTEVDLKSSCDIYPSYLPSNAFSPGNNLTQSFVGNLMAYPALKWQYFMSEEGLHSEYPSHSVGCCDEETLRHKEVYLSTVKPHKKYVVIVVDHGNSLSHNQLRTAKALGKQILSLLSPHDEVGVVGLAGEPNFPSNSKCLSSQMAKGTYETKVHFSRFIDGLSNAKTATNHSVGLGSAFRMLCRSLRSHKTGEYEAVIAYISRGLLSSFYEPKIVMETIAREGAPPACPVPIVIDAYAVIDEGKPIIFEKHFLQELVEQNFLKYNISSPWRKSSQVVRRGVMVAVNSTAAVPASLSHLYLSSTPTPNRGVIFSLPWWDSVGKGLVISLARGCFQPQGMFGIVGVDLHLADVVEDITYFRHPGRAYSFLIDTSGYTIQHPTFPKPSEVLEQPMHTDIGHLEMRPGFSDLRKAIITLPSGERTLKDVKNETGTMVEIEVVYSWSRVAGSPYIVVAVIERDGRSATTISSDSRPPQDLVYHRLDVIPPPKACSLFNHIASTDMSSLFLSASCFRLPFSHLMNHRQVSPLMIQSYMAYLNDATKLIANPGFLDWVRPEVSALSHITAHWKHQFKESLRNQFIVRRYISTLHGVMLMYPASVLPVDFDPVRRPWFTQAVAHPDYVTLTAPYLDLGGAGYIVTLSQTLYAGGAASSVHSTDDGIVAVMGLDLTLGYFWKLLLDTMPICQLPNIQCFMMDNMGYLIAHRALVEPNGPVEQQHITHKEDLVANDILNRKAFITKKACNKYSDRTIQRYYEYNTSFDGIITNLDHGERCARYHISSIPGTNLFLGVINITCNEELFCPCSQVDRLCLNCHRMEQGDCECPCECPLEVDLCSGDLVKQGDQHPPCQTYPQFGIDDILPLSSPTLPPCLQTNCEGRPTEGWCVGVVGCEWCRLKPDGTTLLQEPFCTQQSKCFAGVQGKASPYADPIIDIGVQQHEDFPSTPVGPVAGGLMAGFFCLAIAFYCYRHHLARTRHPDLRVEMARLRTEQDLTESREDIGGNTNGKMMVPLENPAPPAVMQPVIWPYRINTTYRRPTAADSDHGYSTMTPHEDLESLPYIEPLLRSKQHLDASGSSRTSSPNPTENDVPTPPPPQTAVPLLPAPDNFVVAPVQVHAVDTC